MKHCLHGSDHGHAFIFFAKPITLQHLSFQCLKIFMLHAVLTPTG